MVKPTWKSRATIFKTIVFISISLYYYTFAVIRSDKIVTDENDAPKKYSNRNLLSILIDTTPTNILNETPINSTIIAPPTAPRNCVRASILEFPSDGLTSNQRKHGWIVLHVALACYCFWLLAIVCDDYFVPTMESMCLSLKMKEDVIGATFMAAATSSPELFINCIGTFVTKGDIGVGTVVGSAVFNILAVPACCGLFAGQIVHLDWWPVSRDCLMYGVAVVSLIAVLADEIVMWYEGLALVLAYFVYIIVMYCNDSISNKVRTVVAKLKKKPTIRPFREVTEIIPLLHEDTKNKSSNGQHIYPALETIAENYSTEIADSPWKRTNGTSLCGFIVKWPITAILWFTIPDCRKYPKLRCLTFIMCIVWIGVTSYIVAFLITVVGDTINIPDSVMGLTFLAAGTSVPEAVSSVIVTNQGHGAMGISNSIGSNTFDILLCLGLPWFVKSYFFPEVAAEKWITLNSRGLTYSAISLLSTLFGLYISFALNKFRLDWKIGVTCTVMYVAFLIFASLVELNFFFPVNLPTCSH